MNPDLYFCYGRLSISKYLSGFDCGLFILLGPLKHSDKSLAETSEFCGRGDFGLEKCRGQVVTSVTIKPH